MHPTFKICSIFLIMTIQYTDSFPQFSIPFVSWNKNKEEPSNFPIIVQNPLPTIFGKKCNVKQYDKTRENNENVYNNEKIITVTPHAAYYAQPIQDTLLWESNYKLNPGFQDPNQDHKQEQNVNNKDIKKEDHFQKAEYEDLMKQYNFNEDDINRIFYHFDVTSDYTTESSTEYESTTEDLNSLNRYGGVSAHVMATLLGR